jgi:hypothetical protein
MKINTTELRQAFEIFMSHLDECGQSNIQIEEDYYWNIPWDSRYDPLEKPTDLTMGQLTDDWNEVQRIARGERDAIGYGLVWLSTILRRIGETTL